MNWWEWVFSGIGVFIVGGFLEWLRRRSQRSSQQTTVTAQGGKVSNSPVASGSGITQNVNSPTFNLSLPAAATGAPGSERYNEWRELIHELHKNLRIMASAFLPPDIIDVEEPYDYHTAIQKGYGVLRNRILIADVLKNAGMLEKFRSVAEYAISARTPRDPSQRGCPTVTGFDAKASNFEDELMELARKDSGGSGIAPSVPPIDSHDALPSPTTALPPATRASAVIRYIGPRVLQVAQHDYGLWSEDQSSGLQALVLQFTNEAQRGASNFGRTVKASLVYSDSAGERLRVAAGCWINEQSDLCKFRVEETHALLVGLVSFQKLTVISKRRKYGDMGAEILQIDEQMLAGFQQGFVRVRLTDVDSGELLYEENFDLSFNPLKMVPVKTA